MSIEEAATEFAAWLEHRNSEFERRLRFTHSENGRLTLKTEAAELHVIQAKFNELVGKQL
jgi:hypothetical protein